MFDSINNATQKCPVSVVIPTYKRTDILVKTLNKIFACDPQPNETIVHIDGNDEESEKVIKQHFRDIKILKSQVNIGPGGGRNFLITEAKNEIVASFDDDSYPIDKDYFARLLHLFHIYPEASVIAATIYYPTELLENSSQFTCWVATFEGCGCAYRKTDFLKTDGYMQMQWAYGAEEVDLAIQLCDRESKILQTNWLRVFHDTYHEHHKNAEINAASISNLALLAYIRYPLSMWGQALFQVFNRVFYTLKMHRYAGIRLGVTSIPRKIWFYRQYRKPVSREALKEYFRLRRTPVIVPWKG